MDLETIRPLIEHYQGLKYTINITKMHSIQLLLAILWIKVVFAQQEPYSTWIADSMIAISITPTRYYTQATFYRGVEFVYNKTQDSKYSSFLISQLDAVLTSNGSFVDWDYASHQLDNIRVGETLLFLYGATGNIRYKNAADFLRDQINQQKRTVSGGFWHKDPNYPNQMWLDGLFMAEPFYAQYTSMFEPDNATAWDDIVHQFDLIEFHCPNQQTGLLYHGYDESFVAVWANNVTGASPHVWDRAVGWYFMALVDVLDWLPQSHPGHSRLLSYFTKLAVALKRNWDTQGGWWLVMEAPYPGMAGNYIESSGTAMFIYGFLKGMREGYLDKSSYYQIATRAYDAMVEKFMGRNETTGMLTWEGTVNVGSLSGNASYEVSHGVFPVQY